jgi:hypothetical protein
MADTGQNRLAPAMIQVPLELFAHLLAHYRPELAPVRDGGLADGTFRSGTMTDCGHRRSSVSTSDTSDGGASFLPTAVTERTLPPDGSERDRSTRAIAAEAKAKLQVGNGDHLVQVLTNVQQQLAAMQGELVAMRTATTGRGQRAEAGGLGAGPAAADRGANWENRKCGPHGPMKAESPSRVIQNRGMLTLEVEPTYSLRKGLGCWELRYAGRKALIKDERGVAIVAYLLRNPPLERIHAVDLEKLVWAQGFVGETTSPLATESAAELDEQHLTVRSEPGGLARCADDNELLKRKVRELLDIIRDETLPAAERDDAQEKLDEISRAMSGSKGISRDAARAVERVRKAILRLHAHLAAALDENQQPHSVLREFAEHLRKHLILPSARFTKSKTSRNQAGVAGTFTYEPPPGVVWER